MIRLSDAIVIAATKLRTHRIRTTITIILSSLLFAALIAAIIITTGVTKSVAVFNNQGLNNRYLVWAQADNPLFGGVLSTKEFITLAQQKGKDLIIAKQAEAKKLGIDYNAGNEPSATLTESMSGQNSVHVNFQSYAAIEAMQEYVKQHPSPDLNELKQAAANYHPIGFYSSIMAGLSNGNMSIMSNGSENFTPTDDQRVSLLFPGQTSLMVDDSHLTQPFILPGTTTNGSNIPLIVSYSTAEGLLGLPKLPSNASTKDHYDRIQQVYRQTTNNAVTVTTCYRNSVSQQQIDQAISQADEIARNKSNKDYQKPSLIYGLPAANSCNKATIISDKRTAAEKKTQAAQDQFDATFGQVVVPVQQKLTFQVVGLSPSTSNSNTTFSDLLSSIVGSSLTDGSDVIPADLLDKMSTATSVKSTLLADNSNPLAVANPNYYVEFSNANDARRFITDKSCTTRMEGTCASPGRLFQLTASGNNSIALQDLQQKIASVLGLATIGVVVLAVIIMTSMIGRTVADGRRETAVFRALGAKRSDIVAIYAVYTLCLIILIAIISLAVGLGAAYGLDAYYGQDATLQAKLLFDAVNTNLTFRFFSINIALLGVVVVIIVISGLFSMVIPTLRNIRRNPIQDMREE